MVKGFWYVAAANLALVAGLSVAVGAVPQLSSASASAVQPRAFLDQYCVTCHGGRVKAAGLLLDQLDLSQVAQQPDVWEKVVRKLRTGMMPPPGNPRSDEATIAQVQGWLEAALDGAAKRTPNPGRTDSYHRLNRAEYRNVIRDLLSLDVDVSALLPADDSSYGFDNIAGVLKVNQTGLERYLSAARKVSRLAVGTSAPPTGSETFVLSPQMRQYEHVEGLPFGTRGGTLIRYNFPQDGEYAFELKLQCTNTRGGDENCTDGSTGFPDDQQLVLMIDGEVVHEFSFVSKPRKDRYGGDNGINGESQFGDSERLQVRVPVQAGPREVGVTFLRLPAVETVQRIYRKSFSKPMTYRGADRGMQMTVAHLSKVVVSGPFEPQAAVETPSRQAIFACRPATRVEESACARTILTRLARRAYRRPVADVDTQALLRFYNDSRTAGGSFDAGIEDALRALLVSPEFWFRIESDPPNAAPNSVYRVGDLELASRLSFFLWSSIPDEALFVAAERGSLRNPAVLEQQVRRMLADPRARALTSNFTEQWLNLRRISVVTPNESDFPNFDEGLKSAFQQETVLFVDSIMREDRSALDLLNADYTFVNERLAQHYGIPNVRGSRFRRVSLGADNPRRGLLGHGSILTVTSHPTRTSPVKRGKWILEQILGSPPPPPPPNVPALPEKPSAGRVLTMRERMAEHRENAYCAGCHKMLDPVGFALENFDPVGRFRTVDENFIPIDTSGMLADGTKFDSFAEFRAALAKHPDRFLMTLTEKLMTYALGRGAEPFDMPEVRKVVRESAGVNYRFSSLVLGIVKSVPFQMRRTVAPGAGVTASR